MHKIIETKIWRGYQQLKFRWRDHRRHNRLVLEKVGGYNLLILPEVFNPALFWTSDLLARYLNRVDISPGTRVLDLGTGSGIGAIAAAQKSGNVIAVDINPEAARCARINLLLNRLEDRVQVITGDLFHPVKGKTFDLVLFNPPYFHGQPKTSLEFAFYAGEIPLKFARDLAQHLSPGGEGLIVLSNLGERDQFLRSLMAKGFQVQGVAEKNLPGEQLTIFRIWRDHPGSQEFREC